MVQFTLTLGIFGSILVIVTALNNQLLLPVGQTISSSLSSSKAISSASATSSSSSGVLIPGPWKPIPIATEPAICTPPCTRPFEICKSCGSPCPPTCNKVSIQACPPVCVPNVCQCIDGFIRAPNGDCVRTCPSPAWNK